MDMSKYRDISPLAPSEVPQAIERLLGEDALRQAYESLGADIPWGALRQALAGVGSVDEFKQALSAKLVRVVMDKTCREVAPLQGREHITSAGAYTYISNHRDIILDGAFLNVLLYEADAQFPEIAIGDNLLVAPWVETLVKLNGSFLVHRSLKGREFLLASKLLSSYMHDAIESGRSLWIAQREGRAKDSDDRTQGALLKMLSLGYKRRNFLQALEHLNIVPVTCSYEYDPCDYLKAREMQLKRDLPHYAKTKAEDALNMKTGVLGYKGRVSFSLGRPLTALLQEVELPHSSEAEQVQAVANLIDQEMHLGYRLYPSNYIAWDRLLGKLEHSDKYTPEDKQNFDVYLQGQLDKIYLGEGLQRDIPYLTECLLTMYANPAINHYRALQSKAAR